MKYPVFNPPYMDLRYVMDDDSDRPWQVVGDHSFSDRNIYVCIEDGFRTDLASVPTVLAWLYCPNGRHQPAAVFHDWMYRQKTMSRFSADAIFRVLLAYHGVVWWRRLSMYYAVRLFGGFAWRAKS